MTSLDYRSLGLKVGLEIHQQLSAGKLFCSCPCELSDIIKRRFNRQLRPSQSEMGEVDQAALEEAQKKLRFTYESTPFDCIVEADEEPPHSVNNKAVRTTLIFSRMVDARPVDEIQFMRKIVIDGSNTTGFQRTALVSTKGKMKVGGKNIGIETICLEEDAARRIAEEDHNVVFRLDRLGIPLIEIATSPDIETPEETREVAERLGTLLRATRSVRRGIGSIREDINVSISGGARVEVKGVQELDLLPSYVHNEALRQLALIDVKKELSRHNIKEVQGGKIDISKLLSKTKSRVLSESLANGGIILVTLLQGFAGLLRPDERGVKRLGVDMAAHAKVAGVGGIFHSDELPGYGITEKEVEVIRSELGADKMDCFVMVADSAEKASAALDRVIERARQALVGVPEETRDPLPDGTTAYSRPLPGRERMYPETDVPPFPITNSLMLEVEKQLPEYPDEIIKRLREEHSLSKEQAETLVKNGYDIDFDGMIKAGISPKLAARTLIHTLPELESEGLDVSQLKLPILIDLLFRVESGAFAKEAVPMLLRRMVEQHEGIEEAIGRLDLSGVGESEVENVIDKLLEEKRALVLERGERCVSPLMGLVMKELRGKADGKLVNTMLLQKVRKILTES